MSEKPIFWEGLPLIAAINTFHLPQCDRLPNTPAWFLQPPVLQGGAELDVDEPKARGPDSSQDGAGRADVGPEVSVGRKCSNRAADYVEIGITAQSHRNKWPLSLGVTLRCQTVTARTRGARGLSGTIHLRVPAALHSPQIVSSASLSVT